MENVAAITHKANIKAFEEWIGSLTELGYTSSWALLNTKDFDVPQNRNRCFMVSILDGGKYEFPGKVPPTRKLIDVLEDGVDEKYYVSEALLATLTERKMRENKKSEDSLKIKVMGDVDVSYEMARRIYDVNGVAPTLTTRGDVSRCVKIAVYPCMNPDFLVMKQKGPRFRADGEPAHTLTTFARHGVALGDPLRVRRLTPRECWRLQDFTDEQYDIASKVVSETQLYKQAGNSITVRVLEQIFRNLYVDRKVDKRVNTLYSFERNDK